MTTMIEIKLEGARQIEGIGELLSDVRTALENRINLCEYSDNIRPVTLTMTTTMRTCLLVGLSDTRPRNLADVNRMIVSKNNEPYPSPFYAKGNFKRIVVTLLKLRYHELEVAWESTSQVAKILGHEMMRGRNILLQEGGIDEWLRFTPVRNGRTAVEIPALQLRLGTFENEMDAFIDLNGKENSNAQILIAGATGSGKSNLLAVLIHQIRAASSDTRHPVNFLLFDYKGEFSDPANASWLEQFDTDEKAILNPMERPLPFTPFKDFTGRPIQEINLYSSSLSKALAAIANDTRISANMDDRLSMAIINAYKATKGKPVTFEQIRDQYIRLLPEKKQEITDSVISVLNQLIRSHLFEEEDRVDLLKECYIIHLGKYEKEGIYAKAIVYFVIAKLNAIYETLPVQLVDEKRYELRHFTIIDEAHYMLGFDNQPLQNLIKVGRNKGMSILLATQNMSDYKSKYFDFFANAQYPMIMRQQTQNDQVIKDLFGVSGKDLQEIKQVIASLQKGELVMKDANAMAIGYGKHYSKIRVTHLI